MFRDGLSLTKGFASLAY